MDAKYRLEEINLGMGQPEYEMYRDIPAKESGSTNLCNGLPFDVFPSFIESQMARKYQTISPFDTPTAIYIFYVNDKPIGYAGLRLDIDEKWKKWSGNIFYAVRSSARGKGYGTALLDAMLKEAKNHGIDEVLIQSSAGNIASQKIIEKNGGKFLSEDEGTRYYKITI